MELAPQFRAELVPVLPVRGRGAGQAMQQTGFPDQGFGDGMSVRDGGQFRVEKAGKWEQVVTMVLPCEAQRTDALGILGLAVNQLLDDEVEQHLPYGQRRPSQRQS